MKIEIRKYKFTDGNEKNYFGSPSFVDKIEFTEIYDEGFPIWNEEFSLDKNIFELVASDFDIKFSLLSNTTSQNGKTIESFFREGVTNHCLICKISIDNKIVGGIIDRQSFNFNYTYSENRYDVQFTIYDIIKEFKDFVQGKPLQPTFNVNTFHGYIGGTRGNLDGVPFFTSENGEWLPAYITFDFSNLNWVARCGYEPVLVHELWAEMINSGALPDDCNCWTLFEDLCNGFGLIYKLNIEPTDVGNYFKIKISLAFRDTGFSGNTLTLDIIQHNQGYYVDDNVNEIQIFKYGKVVGSGNTDPDESVYYGLIYDSTRKIVIDAAAFHSIAGWSSEYIAQNENGGLYLNEIRSLFPAFIAENEKINFVEFNHYIKTAKYIQTINTQGWRYYVFATPTEATWNEEAFTHLTRKAYPFPRFWTKVGWEIQLSQWKFFDANSIAYIDNPGNKNTHDLWYDLILQTAYKNFNFLVGGTRRTLKLKVSLINGYNINLWDKTIIDNVEYVLHSIKNLDLYEKTADTEWLELRQINVPIEE